MEKELLTEIERERGKEGRGLYYLLSTTSPGEKDFYVVCQVLFVYKGLIKTSSNSVSFV